VAAEGSSSIDALGQFQLHPALGSIGASVNFTQSNLMMVIAGLLVLALLWFGMKPRAMVPGRLQAAAELGYEAMLSMCVDTIGPEGRKFFPFVFTLFFFILFGNLLGVFPYFFTFTSHIMVTLALTLMVFVLVTAVALKEHGLHFFSYFLPKGIPVALAPLLVVIEVISYLSRIIWSRDAGGVRRLHHHAGRSWLAGLPAGGPGLRARYDPDRIRDFGGEPTGLCLCNPDLHLSARRGSPALNIAPQPLNNRAGTPARAAE
jgi:ATP synthase subunit 6